MTMTARAATLPSLAALLLLAIAACSGTSSPQASKPAASSTHAASRGTAAATNSPQPGGVRTSGGGIPVGCGAGTVERVSTAAGLSAALANARPGTKILLAPGVYQGDFEAALSGTRAAPIWMCGSRNAILQGTSITSGYTFHLNKASWWRLEGFSVEGGQKGVVADGATHDLIYGLYVHGTGDEAIHLRSFSSYNVVSHNVVRDTGLDVQFFGEGIYVGSAHENWCKYTGCEPDGSNDNMVTDNNIADTTAENIDIKEGTRGGTIVGNALSGTGMVASAATAWINVKGNDWKILDNRGVDTIGDGYQVHQVYPGWGIGNIFRGNKATVRGTGFGIYVQSHHLQTTVACSNTVLGVGSQLSNIPCENS